MKTRQAQREELASVHQELKAFQDIRPGVFYIDIVLTSLILWSSLYFLSVTNSVSTGLVLGLVVYVSMYRAGALIHEVIHFRNKVSGLEELYNLMIGFPMRIPAYIHVPHQYHHNPTTFGTLKDPEYLYMKGLGLKIFFRPLLAGCLLPILLLVRFGLFPLVAWTMPRKVKEYVYRHLSTIVVNPGYQRPLNTDRELKSALWQDFFCSVVLVMMIVAWGYELLPTRFFLVTYGFLVVTSIVNIYRARVAHLYDYDGETAPDPLAALRDSVTVTGSVLTSLWAPIGLQYHSLHHLSPQIPYYNLGRAHRHILSKISPDHPYVHTVLPTFVDGLKVFRKTLTASNS